MMRIAGWDPAVGDYAEHVGQHSCDGFQRMGHDVEIYLFERHANYKLIRIKVVVSIHPV
jgi:hypothetical protein